MNNRFERFELLVGKDKVSSLSNKCVLVVGCGGVGGYTVEALSRSNIGKLILVDFDKVDITNCNRQLIALNSNIGKYKVDCFKERINDINPLCNVKIYNLKLTEDNICDIFNEKIDYVVDACDDTSAKISLIEYCTSNNIPIISSMGTGNRLDPSLIHITTLDKTENDPLAKVMRKKVREKSIKNKITVCTSKELPIKTGNSIIASCSFVPATAGLLIASHVIKELLK